MIFTAPWLLLALLGLPALWWLLRVTPPAPRRLDFPSVRLLLDLPSPQTPSRTPLWLLALRIAAAGILIVGLAGPILGQRTPTHASGTLALVLDDGFASAADWPRRIAAADRVAAEAARAGRPIVLLTTAPGPDGAVPAIRGPMPAIEAQAILPTLSPAPWPADRRGAARALRASLTGLTPAIGSVAYVADGLTDGNGWDDFAAALAEAAGGSTALNVLANARPEAAVLSATPTSEGWTMRLAQSPSPGVSRFGVRAEAADGRVLAHIALTVPAGAGSGTSTLGLPTELRNRVDRLSLEDGDGRAITSAASLVLLDEADRRHPVGLLDSPSPGADVALTGSTYFLRRALAPYAEWRQGSLSSLLERPVSVLLAADLPFSPGADAEALRGWIERGGTLIRFAGPEMAQAAQDGQPDPLLPVPLLQSDRQMGGSMSWGKPASLAPFPAESPFTGLTPAWDPGADPGADPGHAATDVTVSRQVLADPAADLGSATWARLTDGTPLVTQRPIGAGRVVLFHVTANADWSNLPLSGLFVDMLRRLLAQSAGVAGDATGSGDLAPARVLDGFGGWITPGIGARPIAATAFAGTVASPAHPPGLYGPEGARRVLNLSQGLPDPQAAPTLPGSRHDLTLADPARPIGPLLVAIALVLLLADLLASLRARGLLSASAAALVVMTVMAAAGPGAHAVEPYDAALATRLANVRTGDEAVDSTARAGLAGLSNYINERTAAELAAPMEVVPGHDDLSFFPLLYWPLSADAPPPDAAAIAALNAYMAAGGVILIDTRDGGSGAAMGGGGRDVLRRLSGGAAGGAGTEGLNAPPLAPLTSAHVLARSFYLLSDFPGRYDGDTVWVARDVDRSNDSVSPLIIGAHDWAAAWAVDADGQHPFATLPGGDRQRTLAYRFGVNIVMYSLTGNYKGDQVHVPALLQRLGQ